MKQSNEEADDDKHCFPYYDFMRSLYRRFDGSFISIAMLENFSFGLWILIDLETKELFKSYMGIDPGDMAVYVSLINLPWSIKILYGLLSDNLKICGLYRKPYLIISGFVQFIAMLILFIVDFEEPVPVVCFLFLANMSSAFSGVVIEAILVN